MKDLLVYVADADALAFIKAVLDRPQALGIRPVTFDIERHPQKDSGMVHSGAELARMKKGGYSKVLLMWDHHGSGRDHRHSPELVAAEIQSKLDAFTWKDNSAVSVLVPELEQWLWHCESAVAAHADISAKQLKQWVTERAEKLGITPASLKASQPKELFEHIMREKIRRTISPRNFGDIAERASVPGLLKCASFGNITAVLRQWFPLD